MHTVTRAGKGLSLVLPFLILFLLSGCGAYDRVADWYKYRNDFRLPKEGEAVAQAGNRHSEPQAQPRQQPLVVPAASQLSSPAAAPPEPVAAPPARPRPAAALAAAGPDAGLQEAAATARQYRYAPDLEPEKVQQAANRPKHWLVYLGLGLGALAAFLAIAVSTGYLLIPIILAAVVVSLMGLARTGPRRRYGGRGYALLGLALSAVALVLLVAFFKSEPF